MADKKKIHLRLWSDFEKLSETRILNTKSSVTHHQRHFVSKEKVEKKQVIQQKEKTKVMLFFKNEQVETSAIINIRKIERLNIGWASAGLALGHKGHGPRAPKIKK
jgi:hypothetical protein